MRREHYSEAEVRLRELLREKRRQRGVTQVALSHAMGNSRAFVSKVESGERFLTFTEVILICRHLGVEPASLVQEVARCVPGISPLEPQPSKVGRPSKKPKTLT